ncbi:MAG TPA: cytochrome P450 [Solirubrobacterales bacterium]|nr:cytochrome P450 [Solirubrobacterales bacterium]
MSSHGVRPTFRSAATRLPRRADLPPGPRLPRALQAVGWTQRPLPWLERCQQRYGDTFTLRILHWGDWVLLCDPDDVKKVFTAGDAVGVDVANPMLGPVLGPRSVMLLEEPEHMTRRKLMLPAFHGKSIETDGEMMAEVARREISRWPVGEPFPLWPRMQEITLEVVMRAVFGPDAEERLGRLRDLLRKLTVWMNEPRNLTLLATFGPEWIVRSSQFRRAMEPVEDAVMEEVRRRRAEGEVRQDVVSMLVEARYEDGSPMSEQDLRDELLTLLTDGPTSTSLAWTFERLLRNPDKLELAREDVRSGDGTYLDAVIKETLRLCPPVPVVVRHLLEPMRLGGYDLPAGTTVAPCIHLIHRSERYYPQAKRFLPERFVGKQPGTYTWIPFGGGTRRCLAASYAELEMKRVLRTVFSEVDLRPVETRSERMRKSAISFAPDRRGLVIAEPW